MTNQATYLDKEPNWGSPTLITTAEVVDYRNAPGGEFRERRPDQVVNSVNADSPHRCAPLKGLAESLDRRPCHREQDSSEDRLHQIDHDEWSDPVCDRTRFADICR